MTIRTDFTKKSHFVLLDGDTRLPIAIIECEGGEGKDITEVVVQAIMEEFNAQKVVFFLPHRLNDASLSKIFTVGTKEDGHDCVRALTLFRTELYNNQPR